MALSDTHLQLHYSLQAAAGVGRTLLPPRPDDSHASFAWSDAHGALVQDVDDGRFRSGVRVRDMSLVLIDAEDRVSAEYPMCGHTLDDGFRFYEERVGRTLARSGEPLPEHSVANGASFAPSDEDLAVLASVYGDAAAILERLRAQHGGATPVRCWPHHFDIALLINVDKDHHLGVGFLGGDANIPEPYWYVYAWPMPENTTPPLTVGRWYAGAWLGAVLTGRNEVGTVEMFLREAISALM
ncbi:MAG TPA: hypothetical protein VNA69_18890 [Thermoanaerobaculia bacterium]|nr:hypothetical protein [Thermoanaerobaculia bacterium]